MLLSVRPSSRHLCVDPQPCVASCLSDPPATNEDAIDQLRFKAARLRVNGIMDVFFCDSAGSFDLGKNCWSSVKCRGTAITVGP